MSVAVSTDMHGSRRIHAELTTALRTRAQILKIPTEHAQLHPLLIDADAMKITHGIL